MKKREMNILMALALVVALAVPAMGQGGNTKVQGTVTDDQGKPMADVAVEMQHRETGRRIHLKTDKRGQFFSLGVQSGSYKITFSKDGKPFWIMESYPVRLTPEDLVTINLDLAKERKAAATEGQQKMTEEQKKEQERLEKENLKIGDLNKLLAQGQAQLDAGNFDQAISSFKTATDMDPSRDLLWARLGDAYNTAARKSTDNAQRKEYYSQGAVAYRKALDIATAGPGEGAAAKTLKTPEALGAYYNNLGESLGRSGDTPGAIEAYDKAAQVNPTNAALYYTNKGAVLTNGNKVDEAIAAFDKAIAADPTRADAYYLKGTNLLSKATMKGNEIVPAPGTAEAFNKYLELDPEGKYAQQAKDMLTAIGAKVETTYRSGKKGSTKK